MLIAKGSAGRGGSLSLRHITNAITKEHIDLNTIFITAGRDQLIIKQSGMARNVKEVQALF